MTFVSCVDFPFEGFCLEQKLKARESKFNLYDLNTIHKLAHKVKLMFFRIVCILLVCHHCAMAGQSLTTAIHRTQAAQERINDLRCYKCDTMEDGEACVAVMMANTTSFVHKCEGEEFICMVKRFSYTTSTENSTSSPKMWSLDRRCAVNCEPGCIVIGERTKLYACTSCCETSLCNTGKGSASSLLFSRIETGIGTLFSLVMISIFPNFTSLN